MSVFSKMSVHDCTDLYLRHVCHKRGVLFWSMRYLCTPLKNEIQTYLLQARYGKSQIQKLTALKKPGTSSTEQTSQYRKWETDVAHHYHCVSQCPLQANKRINNHTCHSDTLLVTSLVHNRLVILSIISQWGSDRRCSSSNFFFM